MCLRADEQLKVQVLDQQESELQMENEKSKNFTAELSSTNDKVPIKDGSVRKQEVAVRADKSKPKECKMHQRLWCHRLR